MLGFASLVYFIWNIIQLSDRVGSDLPAGGYFVGVAFAWWYLSDLVVVGFSLSWGRWPQAAVFPIALALVVADLVAYESAWGPPLGWGVFFMTELLYGYIGVSFLLGGIFAVPG